MKKIHFLKIIILVVIVIVSANCTKEVPATGYSTGTGTTNPPPPPPPPSNRPPVANAGVDFAGKLYSNDITLRGSAYDPDFGNTLSITWTKIAGSGCNIVSPNSRTTSVTGLLVGEYQFELLAIDNYGATHRDTINVKITSIEPITSPVTVFNLSWSCPMGCSIPVYDIYKHLPLNTPIRVFIKFANSATWHEAVPMSQYSTNNQVYYYDVDTEKNIWLYTDSDENINVDVRILF